MKSHKLVRGAYKKNTKTYLSMHHNMTVSLSDWPCDQHEVELESDDFPYLKLALLDRHLDEEYEGRM